MLSSPLARPALIGGGLAGVLSALPIVSGGNLCCCLWVVSGGLTAAYLLQQRQPTPLTAVDGALVGLLAGLCGAFVYLVLSIPITLLTAPMQQRLLEGLIDAGQIGPEFRDFITSPGAPVALVAAGFMFMLAAGLVFSTLGGMLGAVVFAKSASPAAVRPGEHPPF